MIGSEVLCPAMFKMTGEEMLRRYAKGERDFRGVNLSRVNARETALNGVDFTGADLRGTCFQSASLVGTKFHKSLMGEHWTGWIQRQVFSALFATLAGILLSTSAGYIGLLFMNDQNGLYVSSYVPGLAAIVFIMVVEFLMVLGISSNLPTIIAGITVTLANLVFLLIIVVIGTAVIFVGGDSVAPAELEAAMKPGPLAFMIAVGVITAATAAIACAAAGVLATMSVIHAGIALSLPIFIGYIARFSVANTEEQRISADFIILTVLTQSITIGLIRYRALHGSLKHQWVRDIVVEWVCRTGSNFSNADLTGADFGGVLLRGVCFLGAQLHHTKMRGADGLQWALFDERRWCNPVVQRLLSTGRGDELDLSRCPLSGVYLREASLRGASLGHLQEADLRRADLTEADLIDVDLRGADLTDALLEGARLDGARVDVLTYERSGWTPEMLADLVQRGITVVALQAFPRAAQDRILGEREGLILSFWTRLSAFDRYLVEGAIVGVLGRNTDCQIEEFRNLEHSAVVRLTASRRSDLERVAEALHERVWEMQHQQQKTQLVRVQETIQSPVVREGLSNLMGRRLEKLEMRESQSPGQSGPTQLRWTWTSPAQSGADRLLGPRPRRVFLLHAPDDREPAKALLDHMQPLVKQGLLDAFDAARLLPGDCTDEMLAAHLDTAELVLVLASAALYKDGPWQGQVARALARQKDGARALAIG